jgi:hypothetical protein
VAVLVAVGVAVIVGVAVEVAVGVEVGTTHGPVVKLAVNPLSRILLLRALTLFVSLA